MRKFAFVLFVLTSLTELTTHFIDADPVRRVAKSLIMISLGLYYFFSVRAEDRSRALLGAIFFSFCGDVLLLEDNLFIPGLVAFLISHVLYIFTYRLHRHEEVNSPLQGIHRVRMAFPIILAGSGLVVVLYPVLGDLKIPVMVYATVISVMAIQAQFRMGRTSTASFWLVLSGAVLFMISDSLLAVNKFLQPINQGGFWVMLTYILAQYLIIQGLLAHHKK
ncbi:MAG: lysoplasmalogenase [Bacteroidota bacterium]